MYFKTLRVVTLQATIVTMNSKSILHDIVIPYIVRRVAKPQLRLLNCDGACHVPSERSVNAAKIILVTSRAARLERSVSVAKTILCYQRHDHFK